MFTFRKSDRHLSRAVQENQSASESVSPAHSRLHSGSLSLGGYRTSSNLSAAGDSVGCRMKAMKYNICLMSSGLADVLGSSERTF